MAGVLFQRVLCVVSLCSMLQASVIHFSAAPPSLKANLTDVASMRCSLDDTAGQIGRRDVTNTSDDILHISSIVVTRNNNQHVASITPFDPATALVDLGNLEVKGSVSGLSSEGFLQLTWKDAAHMATGEYTCEVNTINHLGHTVVYSKSLELTAEAPTMDDVIGHFKATIDKLQRQLDDQSGKMKDCMSPRVAFMATISDNSVVTSHAHNVTLVFDHVITDEDGGYDASTGRFTCSTPGVYYFSASAVANTNDDFCLWIKHNDEVVTTLYAWDLNKLEQGASSAVLHLLNGDVVQVVSSAHCDAGLYHDGNVVNGNVFTGHLVHSDACRA